MNSNAPTEERKKKVNLFRFQFEKALAASGKRLSTKSPFIEVSEAGVVSMGSRSLRVEVTSSYRLIIGHFCSQEADCLYSFTYWPYFDQNEEVRYTTNPDDPGFSDPSKLAEHCLKQFIELNNTN